MKGGSARSIAHSNSPGRTHSKKAHAALDAAVLAAYCFSPNTLLAILDEIVRLIVAPAISSRGNRRTHGLRAIGFVPLRPFKNQPKCNRVAGGYSFHRKARRGGFSATSRSISKICSKVHAPSFPLEKRCAQENARPKGKPHRNPFTESVKKSGVGDQCRLRMSVQLPCGDHGTHAA